MRKPISEWLKEMPQDRQETYMVELKQATSERIPEEIVETFIEQFLDSEEESMVGVVSCHYAFDEDSFKDWEEYLIGYYGGAERYQVEVQKELFKSISELMTDTIGDLPDNQAISED